MTKRVYSLACTHCHHGWTTTNPDERCGCGRAPERRGTFAAIPLKD